MIEEQQINDPRTASSCTEAAQTVGMPAADMSACAMQERDPSREIVIDDPVQQAISTLTKAILEQGGEFMVVLSGGLKVHRQHGSADLLKGIFGYPAGIPGMPLFRQGQVVSWPDVRIEITYADGSSDGSWGKHEEYYKFEKSCADAGALGECSDGCR